MYYFDTHIEVHVFSRPDRHLKPDQVSQFAKDKRCGHKINYSYLANRHRYTSGQSAALLTVTQAEVLSETKVRVAWLAKQLFEGYITNH